MWLEDQHVFRYLYRIGDWTGWMRAKVELAGWRPQDLVSLLYQSVLETNASAPGVLTPNQEMIVVVELREHASQHAVIRRVAYRSGLGVLRVYLEQIYCDLPGRVRSRATDGIHHFSQLAELVQADLPEALFYLWECHPAPGFSYDDHSKTVQYAIQSGSLRILDAIYQLVLIDQPTQQQALMELAYQANPKESEPVLRWLLTRTSLAQLERYLECILRFRYPDLLLGYLERTKPILSIQSWVRIVTSRKTSYALAIFLRDVIPNPSIRSVIYGSELYWECFLVSYSDLERYLTPKWQVQQVQSRSIAYCGTVFLEKALDQIERSLL